MLICSVGSRSFNMHREGDYEVSAQFPFNATLFGNDFGFGNYLTR